MKPETRADEAEGIEVRTYFVRGRNALVARADFGELYVDYYLHQAQVGVQHHPSYDAMLKDALAALTLHCASRPWHETWAWTIHFQEPLLNLFVTGYNRRGTVVGQLFTEDVKASGPGRFIADVVREGDELRRSAVDLTGNDVLAAVEHFSRQSGQRPARFFHHGPEDIVMISAQPQCDLAWLEALTEDEVRHLDETDALSLLETRHYRWECGCTDARMMEVLAPVMRRDPEGLFGAEEILRISCPRCGMRHTVTRESLEAYVEAERE
jgi:molecular chaperone Hsp33